MMRFIQQETPLEDIVARYPRLIAHMICESLGYFTPLAAANALKHHVLGQPFFCEWYVCLAGGYDRGRVLEIGRQVVEMAFRNRRRHYGFMEHYPAARAIVAEALRAKHPVFASWF